jgi:alpha-galactosidase
MLNASGSLFTGNWRSVDHVLDNGSEYRVYYQFVQRGDTFEGRVIYPFAVMPITKSRVKGNHFRIVHTLDPQHRFTVEGDLHGNRIQLRASDWDGKFHEHDAVRAPEHEGDPPAYIAPPPVHKLAPNGLAATPPMGWNSWNKFAEHIDGKTVREMADALVSSGMRDAGYVYLIVDGGWQGERDQAGVLQPNKKFGDMKQLAEYVHAKGLKLGLYSSPGQYDCAGYIGSYAHESQDARIFAQWGIDYLKYDWCSAGSIYRPSEIRAVYQKMAEALTQTKRPIVYALCEYGNEDVWKWGADAGGNLWRIHGDIGDKWESMSEIGFGATVLAPWAGPGHWNDPDMLEIGNGAMSEEEYRTHMSLWAMLAAPLLAGNDLRSMSAATRQILLNREVIAIDQDSKGKQGTPVVKADAYEIWRKPLAKGRVAVALFNRTSATVSIELRKSDLGLTGELAASDLWTHQDFRFSTAAWTARVPGHGTVLLRLQPQ